MGGAEQVSAKVHETLTVLSPEKVGSIVFSAGVLLPAGVSHMRYQKVGQLYFLLAIPLYSAAVFGSSVNLKNASPSPLGANIKAVNQACGFGETAFTSDGDFLVCKNNRFMGAMTAAGGVDIKQIFDVRMGAYGNEVWCNTTNTRMNSVASESTCPCPSGYQRVRSGGIDPATYDAKYYPFGVICFKSS